MRRENNRYKYKYTEFSLMQLLYVIMHLKLIKFILPKNHELFCFLFCKACIGSQLLCFCCDCIKFQKRCCCWTGWVMMTRDKIHKLMIGQVYNIQSSIDDHTYICVYYLFFFYCSGNTYVCLYFSWKSCPRLFSFSKKVQF